MPAQAGIQSIPESVINARWFPACAGMTCSEHFLSCRAACDYGMDLRLKSQTHRTRRARSRCNYGLFSWGRFQASRLRSFVAASRCDCAVFSVAEAFVGAIGGLGVGAPEVAVSSGVFSRGKAGVQEQAFGQEVSATFALHNFEFVLHGFILEFGRFTDLRIRLRSAPASCPRRRAPSQTGSAGFPPARE